jgi:hypothetical protein
MLFLGFKGWLCQKTELSREILSLAIVVFPGQSDTLLRPIGVRVLYAGTSIR